MSMEFFTGTCWMKDFFEEDIDKYYFNHLSGAIKFLPYGVLVDHFQHEVYANPDMTPHERMKTWRELEKQYLPHKNYDEIEILEQGGWWMRQSHIFMDPFYYIDLQSWHKFVHFSSGFANKIMIQRLLKITSIFAKSEVLFLLERL